MKHKGSFEDILTMARGIEREIVSVGRKAVPKIVSCLRSACFVLNPESITHAPN